MIDDQEIGAPHRAEHLVIAIDGPAAAGKSTVASRLARHLDALFFDTGVIYRALALVALEQSVDVRDVDRLTSIADGLPIRVTPPSHDDGRQSDIWLGDRDITWAIRTPSVDRVVSAVSAHSRVRDALLELQRANGRSGRVVMVGRDIGTIVMPDADVKIWLDASLDERARRRALDLARSGQPRPLAQVKEELAARDRFDAGRQVAPMLPAADAILVATDGLTVEQVVNRIVEIISDTRGEALP